MSDVNAPTNLANNRELIADLSRFSEGVLTEQQIRRKWRHLDNNVWEAPDDALVDAVEAERVRRVRSGRAAREKAQNLAVQAPDILGTIMTNDGNSPRHRIEAAKELRVVANNGPEVAPALLIKASIRPNALTVASAVARQASSRATSPHTAKALVPRATHC